MIKAYILSKVGQFSYSFLRKRNYSMLLLLFSFVVVQSQTDPVFVRDMNKMYKEKVYLSTDRDTYFSGEKILLNVQIKDAFIPQNIGLSNYVFVDIQNRDNLLVSTNKYKINPENDIVELMVPQKLESDYYLIRAYTNWMKNFTVEDFAYKKITIINPKKNECHQSQPIDSVFVEFFPEGGVLMADMPNKIGIKITGRNNKLLDIDFSIVDQTGKTIGTNSNIASGYFISNLTPSKNQEIKIKLASKELIVKQNPLLVAGKNKILVSSSKDHLKVEFTSSNKKTEMSQDLTLRIFSGGGISYFSGGINRKELYLKKELLPKGLLLFLLTDKEDQVYSYRWILNTLEQVPEIAMELNDTVFGRRELVNAKVQVSNNREMHNSIVEMRVVRSCLLEEKESLLKNYVSQVEIQTGIQNITKENIYDVLLAYQPILSRNILKASKNKTVIHPLESNNEVVRGRVEIGNSDMVSEGLSLILNVVGQRNFYTSTVKKDGSFSFFTNVSGEKQVVIRPKNSLEPHIFMSLEKGTEAEVLPFKFPLFELDTTLFDSYNKAIINAKINHIYKEELKPGITSTQNNLGESFYGTDYEEIDLANYIDLNSLSEVIYEIIPSLWIKEEKDTTYLEMIDKLRGKKFLNGPLMFVDGILIEDLSKILKIPVKSIDRIEVVDYNYYYNGSLVPGIFHVITKRKNLNMVKLEDNLFRQVYKFAKENTKLVFPNYSSDKSIKNTLPDYRNTVYYSSTTVDKNGHGNFSFYTPDEKAEYKLIITLKNAYGDWHQLSTDIKMQ